MATAQKNTGGLIAKTKSIIAKTTKALKPKKTLSAEKAELKTEPLIKKTKAEPKTPTNPLAKKDPAHSPGHRKLNVKGEFPEASGEKKKVQSSALNRMTPADRINRVTGQVRINGFVNSAGSRRRKGSKSAH